jgi:hypothetical protein
MIYTGHNFALFQWLFEEVGRRQSTANSQH